MESPAQEEERGLLSSKPVPLAGPQSWTDLSRKPKSKPYPRNGVPPPAIQRACGDTLTGPHEDPLAASSGRPPDEGVTGHSPGV